MWTLQWIMMHQVLDQLWQIYMIMWDTNNRENAGAGSEQGMWGIPVLSLECYYKSQMALKIIY